MSKNKIYLVISCSIGLIAGWLIFGQNATNDTSQQSGIEDHQHVGESSAQLWTCAMHPQIKQAEPGDCPICGMDLIPVATNEVGLAPQEIKMTPNALALANVTSSTVGNISKDQEASVLEISGTIVTNKENDAVQSSDYTGRLDQLFVSYQGQQITKGMRLATIYAPKLIAAQQELITAASLKASQPALYRAVRNKLKNWKLSTSQIDAIERSGKVRENFPVYANITGTVSEVMAQEGDYIQEGQALVKVSNLSSVWAQFDVYEDQIASLEIGQEITIKANAYPDKTFQASVSFIDPVLSNSTRTVSIRATLSNTNNIFKPGMFITATLTQPKASVSEGIRIPATAVLWTGERSIVYVKTNPNNPVFEMRQVQLGQRLGDQYLILEGLTAGEEIVTQGTFSVDAAAQLQGKRSMMQQEMTSQTPQSAMALEFSERFKSQFKAVLPVYLQMKDAFITSDVEQVRAFAKAGLAQFEALPIKDLNEMERKHVTKSLEYLNQIVQSDKLEDQRAAYVLLNQNLIPIAKNAVKDGDILYVQKCPMANNNNGAVWLSSDQEIRNPYYGDAMLTCGSVINTIK
ncbi:MAG: efflux RND transporter periplasmic adaptor subunit [Dokdonia sp.]|jgi:Cu(I)/Ag(I) efflux system membrane fusion protein